MRDDKPDFDYTMPVLLLILMLAMIGMTIAQFIGFANMMGHYRP